MASYRGRILFVALLFGVLFLTAIGRLFYLQVLKADYYERAAGRQQKVVDKILPERGNIYLNSLAGGSFERGSQKDSSKPVPLAISRTWYNVWVAPNEIPPDRKDETAAKLAELLALDKETVAEKIGKIGDPYEPLKDKVDKKVALDLEGLGYKGVHRQAFQDRYYPLGEFASQVVGFVGKTGEEGDKAKAGRYGLEGYYDGQLRGESGYVAGVRKALGSLVLPLSRVVKAKRGNDIYLTVDYNIQLALEKELKKAMDKFSAEGASGLVLDPNSGAVMAMASWPTFDPNKYNEVKDSKVFLNPNTQLVFEPGSIFKPITMAAALDINAVSPELTYYDSGEVTVGDHTIRNSTLESWGEQTMTQVLEKSLNTGAVFVLKRIPHGVWRQYIGNFGFGEKTGIALSGEARGDIGNLQSGVELDRLVSYFGHSISVTPLAMVNAIAAVANGGELLRPYLVDRIIETGAGGADNLPKVVFRGSMEVKRRALKPATAETLTKMLVGVVENGSGRQARIPGYTVAGKTGTAQVAAPSGGYTDKTIHTFVGYSPAFKPAFVMLVRLDNPKGVEFSEATAAPVFRTVGEYILHYLGVQPDKPLQYKI